jgi:hypothetical protein
MQLLLFEFCDVVTPSGQQPCGDERQSLVTDPFFKRNDKSSEIGKLYGTNLYLVKKYENKWKWK